MSVSPRFYIIIEFPKRDAAIESHCIAHGLTFEWHRYIAPLWAKKIYAINLPPSSNFICVTERARALTRSFIIINWILEGVRKDSPSAHTHIHPTHSFELIGTMSLAFKWAINLLWTAVESNWIRINIFTM